MRSRIYGIVRRIPRGSVLSYGEVAKKAGTGPRQVGAALRESPEGLPWHRVVGAGGRIVTPGETAMVQGELLRFEGVIVHGRRCKVPR